MSNVDHPSHYNQYNVEVIEIARYFDFAAGNCIKYIARAPFKGNLEEDLEKAMWYARYHYDHRKKTHVKVLSDKKFYKLKKKVQGLVDAICAVEHYPFGNVYAQLIEYLFWDSFTCPDMLSDVTWKYYKGDNFGLWLTQLATAKAHDTPKGESEA